jgi:hypothetical protein
VRENKYHPSEDVVARQIEGELILVPLTSDGGSLEDELYTLNETGRAIWERLDGKKSLGDVTAELSKEFDTPPEEIERDVLGFTAELLRRKMLVEVGPEAL